MSRRGGIVLSRLKLALLAAAAIFFAAHANVDAAEAGAKLRSDLSMVDMPERPLSLVLLSPLVEQGVALGLAVVYDDPSTQRPSDYLEVYNRDGSLVAVAWFDRFGIQRVAVDRAFIDGEDELEGVFVPLIEGDFI
ncbi:MAG TPA: hypothetical protein VH985_12850 [Candidatus Binatia bacterium]|jgi:hypothetical protein